MRTHHEWVVEVTTTTETPEHEKGEVLDHYFATTYADAAEFAAEEPIKDCAHIVVLVRDTDDERTWAYMTDGSLPEHFRCAFDRPTTSVPVRFVREVERYNRAK